MESNRQKSLLAHQNNILSKIALGESLNDIFDDICLAIEDIIDDKSAKCSILSLNADRLFHCAAPSMDPKYSEIINGIKIGDAVGSCGTAAYRNSRIIAENIETSLLWQDFKEIAIQFNLKSCWSTPITSSQSIVLGSFAIYHDHPKTPSKKDLELIDYFVNFSSIALEKLQHSSKVEKLINDLEVSNKKLNAFTKVMPDPALILNEDGLYLDVYGSSEDLLAYSVDKLINKNVNDILPKKYAAPIMAIIKKTLSSNEVQVFEYELEVKKGIVIFEGRTTPIIYDQPGAPPQKHVLWVTRDITLRKKAEKEIEKLAYYDPLTNLPNRRLLTERLTRCVERIKRTHKAGALLFLDIDNFKRINDSLGHSAGDELLIEMARRLGSVVRAADTLARIGGDEFVILLEYIGENNKHATNEAAIVAQKLQQVFYDKFQIGALAFQVSGSIGICLIENANSNVENILKFADTAMYRAKVKGGNSYSFYDSRLQTLLEKQTKLETDIIRAIDNNEFCAYFQPQVDIAGLITGGEALIRWKHPIKGLIAPNEFIPIAEQFGLIQKLQNIVLQDICCLINQLVDNNVVDDTFNLSINISQNQFNSSTLKTELLSIVNKFNVHPSRIKLEITESMLAHDPLHTVQQMEELKAIGFTFSIDDFGTGYSCLSHLHAYPVKELKVDKSFIDNISDHASGLSIVEAIINLAKNLDITVVAEGVETQQQFNILKAMHIDAIQGYLIAKPMPFEHYLKWHKQYLISPECFSN
ncbi:MULTISPECIES: EAL domain-containing protein [Psychromonas]|uniref:sensor domain-containing phosphodiesterase n=1 Tax=Psychromonas TaxID=67572 RepID=UPI0004168DFA|nr:MULTISPECIES: EAL domain-containing protein [Psychromonas]MBB1274309.1 EAL domain-containing protein [Psychromonas sp. SR45-3]